MSKWQWPFQFSYDLVDDWRGVEGRSKKRRRTGHARAGRAKSCPVGVLNVVSKDMLGKGRGIESL